VLKAYFNKDVASECSKCKGHHKCGWKDHDTGEFICSQCGHILRIADSLKEVKNDKTESESTKDKTCQD